MYVLGGGGWTSENNLWKSVLSCHKGPGDQTQVFSLGSKHFYLWRHLAGMFYSYVFMYISRFNSKLRHDWISSFMFVYFLNLFMSLLFVNFGVRIAFYSLNF